MAKNDGKTRFWNIMLEDNLITREEFKMMRWYNKNVKPELDEEAVE